MTDTKPIASTTASPSEPAYWDAQFWLMLQGNDKAFDSIFRGFDSKLRRFLMREVGSTAGSANIEDLIQGVWMRFIDLRRRPPKRSEEPFLVQAYLFRVAKNLSIDFLRTRKDHASIESLDEWDHPATKERTNRHEAEGFVERAILELSDEYREVLALNILDGYRLDEIAAMLGKSPEAIWQRASRARAKLRRLVVEMAQKEKISLRAYLSEKESAQ